jgi:flagellar protein FlgJ
MADDLRVDLTPAPQDRALPKSEQKVMAAAREFESLMIHQMLQAMRATVHPGGVDGGSTMGTYQDMMDEQMSRDLARGHGLGLADSIAREFLGHAPGHSSHPHPAGTDGASPGLEPPRHGNNP